MINTLTKIAYVFAALLLFDLTTSFFYIHEVWYWLGLLASAGIVAVFFDRLED